jgi:antitoxin (DNA-binding transcriptional repressor) of toxin-antitoxin stability system
MDISVSEFKAHCLDIIRRMEKDGQSVTIKRRGKIVARLTPLTAAEKQLKPWEKLRGTGVLLGNPEDSVLMGEDFMAAR